MTPSPAQLRAILYDRDEGERFEGIVFAKDHSQDHARVRIFVSGLPTATIFHPVFSDFPSLMLHHGLTTEEEAAMRRMLCHVADKIKRRSDKYAKDRSEILSKF